MLTVDVEEAHQGAVMEELGRRRGDLQDMQSDGKGRVRLEYRIPARGLIGFQGEFLTLTRGTGLISHVFDDYGPMAGDMAERRNGVLISAEDGRGRRLRAVEAAGSRPHVRRARRPAVRRHDHRHPLPRQRPGGQPDQGQAAHQRARLGHRRSRAPGAADPAHARIRRSSSSPTTNWSRSRRSRSACASATSRNTSASAPTAKSRSRSGADCRRRPIHYSGTSRRSSRCNHGRVVIAGKADLHFC